MGVHVGYARRSMLRGRHFILSNSVQGQGLNNCHLAIVRLRISTFTNVGFCSIINLKILLLLLVLDYSKTYYTTEEMCYTGLECMALLAQGLPIVCAPESFLSEAPFYHESVVCLHSFILSSPNLIENDQILCFLTITYQLSKSLEKMPRN